MDNDVSHSLASDLNEDQLIQQLLDEAHSRLQSSSSTSKKSSALVVEAENSSQQIPRIPRLSEGQGLKPYIQQNDEVATINNTQIPLPSVVISSEMLSSGGVKPASKDKEKANAGNDWFNMPKTKVTAELKRDLQLLQMRNVLDPKRHYKKESGNAVPEYSQTGTIVEGPSEFFKSRIVKKDRKQTFVQEALSGEQNTGRFKNKYNQIQQAKTSGKKAHYNRLLAKRRR